MTETKFCPLCKLDVPVEDWIKNKSNPTGLGSYCKVCHNKKTNEEQRQKRHQLLAVLGGVCVRCGYSDARALQIDPLITGKKLNSNSAAFYNAVMRNPDQYQILCANCACIQHLEERLRR